MFFVPLLRVIVTALALTFYRTGVSCGSLLLGDHILQGMSRDARHLLGKILPVNL